jgi:transketolase
MESSISKDLLINLKEKVEWVTNQTLMIHKRAPETRLASSLSAIEIFVSLYYGKILNFDPQSPLGEARDRFIISKGHGSVSMYPILGDLGFFDIEELHNVCKEGSFLGAIPDPIVPGYETINGSLGHGLGVACGCAVALRRKKSNSKVFVLVGDGELYEGANWESAMFAAHHQLDNLTVIVDYNKICMLGHCENVIDFFSLAEKFKAFHWDVEEVDGHSVEEVYLALDKYKTLENKKPKIIVAHTLKGKGVPQLENKSLSHVMGLNSEGVLKLIEEKNGN